VSWARVDDGMLEHAKWQRIEALGPREWAECLSVWLAVNLYANQALTDGSITWARLERLTPLKARARVAADRLIEAGLMDRTDTGCVLHDFLDYNASAAERAAKTAAKTRRQKKWREATAASVDAPVDASTGMSVDSAPPRAQSPSPSPSPSQSESHARAPVAEPEPEPAASKRYADLAPARPRQPTSTLTDPSPEDCRRAVVKGLKTKNLVAETRREVTHLDWPGWHQLARWAHSSAELTGSTPRARINAAIHGWLEATLANGCPIGWLAQNPDQYATTEAA
jgi:hypothetical protein